MTLLATDAPHAVWNVADCPRPLEPVRAAVVGLGRAGVAHTAVLSAIPGCEVVAVADSRKDARKNLRGMGFSAAGFESVEKLLSRTRPAAVFVSTPHDERAVTARVALEAGAAVLVDAPFATNLGEAEDLVRLAMEKGAVLACGHPLAYHPVFACVRSVLASGALGTIRRVRSSTYLSRVFSTAQKRLVVSPHSAGGVVAHAATDLLFLLVACLGTPVTVRATWSHLYGELEDELHGMLTLPDGVEVGFDSSWCVPGYPRPATVIELEAENGKLLASDDAIELDLIEPRAGIPAGHTRLGHTSLPQVARFDLEGESLYLQDSAFLAWATGGARPANHAEAALQTFRVMNALYASAREGRKPVAVAP